MRTAQENLLDALERVEEFLKENDELMGRVLPPTARQRFSAFRERLAGYMKSQAGSRRVVRSRVEAKAQLRDELIDGHMRPITLMARLELKGTPTPPAFALPQRKGRYASIIAAGYGLAEAAKSYEEAFVAAGLPADFIRRLVAATDALQDGVNAKSHTTSLRVEATAGLDADGRAARRYLLVLDSIVRAGIKSEKALLARWENVSRVATVAAVAAESAGTPVTPDAVPVTLSSGSGSNVGVGSGGRDEVPAEFRAEGRAQADVAA